MTSFVFADEINHSYDDAGRLVRVEKGFERVLYQYDEVGNLISISRDNTAPQALPPVLQGINPDSFVIGSSYVIAIAGQNLLTTTNVTSDNPNVSIKNISVIDTKISATISIADGASPGQANITVTTSYGSASIPITLHAVTLSPSAISLFPLSTGYISASLTPSALKDISARINNGNPDIASAQSSVVIPAGGSANLPITALKEGRATIAIGSGQATIFVAGSGGFIGSAPVSVSLQTFPNNTLIYAPAVSVSVGGILIGSVLSQSYPVSVFFGDIFVGPVCTQSRPVSVVWPMVPGAMAVSGPVCVQIAH